MAEFVGEVTSLRKPLIDVPVPLAEFLGKYSEQMINPVLTKDMVCLHTHIVRLLLIPSIAAIRIYELFCTAMSLVL